MRLLLRTDFAGDPLDANMLRAFKPKEDARSMGVSFVATAASRVSAVIARLSRDRV